MIDLTAQEREFRDAIAAFAAREVLPHAREIDERGEFPLDWFRTLGKMGVFGLRYPERYGGAGAGFVTFLVACEELAAASMSLAASAAMQSLMGTEFLCRYGTEEQKQRLLVPAIRGEKIGAFCLSEADAGSDLARISTTFRRDGEKSFLTGSKMWVTSGTVAEFFTVAATPDRSQGVKAIRFFLVERGAPGLQVGRKIPKLGLRASETTELSLDSTPGAMLGECGVKDLMSMLGQIRVMTGVLGLGLGRAATDEAVRYAKQRVCFGRPIAEFQAIQHMIAESATELEAARALAYGEGRAIERGEDPGARAAMAKLFATEAAWRASDRCMRVLAGYGFTMEFAAQRFFRDARFLLIGGGTSEVLRNIIAKDVIGD